ncbi:hypothetical protein PIB30_081061 [Stylosanthes scabra]|uniref:Uncharacterized protein n=1 Tax=Stylosanthes scabra TaxID=79078 RepID=A0ABU6XS26_9FABA|nr:hypothetical protein [Stylosanthes scabra]
MAPRTKIPTKRQRGESSMQQPPEGNPMSKWFESNDDFENYATNFAPRKIMSPRYMELNFFEKHGCPRLLEILAHQNLVEFVKISDSWYPEIIAAAYTTLDLEFIDDDMNFIFKLGKFTYSLDSTKLIELWKLDYSGKVIELKESPIEHNEGYSRQEACTLFNIPFDVPKPTVGYLSLEHRLLHYLIVYVLVPRAHNHGLILEEDLDLMWRMANHKKLNWVVIIATHMRRSKSGRPTKGLPYAMLWTKIFKDVGIKRGRMWPITIVLIITQSII